MNISCTNGKATVNVGGYETWQAFCSTIVVNLSDMKNEAEKAFDFLRSGNCASSVCLETARQMNLIHDRLAMISPDKMVFDADNPTKQAPWKDNISPTITSCANYFTSADGYDLIAEIVRVLTFAHYTHADVHSV